MKVTPINISFDKNGIATVTCNPDYNIKKSEIFRIKNHKGETEKICQLHIDERQLSASFIIGESGYYFAKSEIVDKHERSHFVESTSTLFIKEEKKESIKKTLSSQNCTIDKIPFFPSPYPQIDFLVEVRSESTGFCDVDMQSLTGVFFYVKDLKNGIGKARIFSTKPTVKVGETEEIFSGYAWQGEDFFFGDSDWYSNYGISRRQLNENLGNYTYITASDTGIEIGSDFLGFSRLFCYKKDSSFFVSNRYHLLLLFLKSLGFSLVLDLKKIEALFLSNVTLFRQVMTHDLWVKDTHLLPSYYCIKVEDGNVIYKKKKLFDLLSEPVSFEESRYQDIVFKAADEIKNNVRAVFNNAKFDRVIVDLSGGRDSRVGYAALTNVQKKIAEKARIRSTLHEPDDLQVAIQVNNVFGYPYHDEGDLIEFIDPLIGLMNKRSYYLGYHFLWYCPTTRYQSANRIRITGESFEALSVRYYSNVLRSPHQTKDLDSLVTEFLRILSRQCVLDFNIYGDLFAEQLKDVLNNLPGQSAQEKFDSLFLLFRGSFHAGNLDRMYYEPACCMPLQSKNLLLAKRMWQSDNDYNRIIYDITYLLNPLLLTIPYNSQKTNAEFLSKREEMLIGKSALGGAYLKNLLPDIFAWDQAYNAKNARDLLVGNSDANVASKVFVGETESVQKLIKLEFNNYASALYSECNIIQESWRNDLLIPLYWYVNEFTSDSDEIRVCHHKLATLYDLTAIIRGFN